MILQTWFDSSKHALVRELSKRLDHDDKMYVLEETLLHHLGKTAEILVFLIRSNDHKLKLLPTSMASRRLKILLKQKEI